MPQSQLERLWIRGLLFALAGYALMGRGFAYLFVGEVILVIGLCIFLPTGRVFLLFSDPVLLLWTAFSFWGLCRTVPFLSKYHFDAVRDAVLWGYGGFALLIVAFIKSSEQISRALNTYRKFLFWYLPIIPALVLLSNPFRSLVPNLPWGDNIAIIMLRGGEAGVQLSIAALFLLIFSDRRDKAQVSSPSILRIVGFIGWTFAATVILIIARAGFMAIALPIAVVSVIRAHDVGWKVAGLAIAGVVLAFTVLSSDLITVKEHGRTFDADQMISNLTSIVGSGSSDTTSNTEDTKEWRLIWWGKIIRYTVYGPYRWTGRGFGINLAQEDGPPGMSKEETTLRSPHNANMTVLARTGVPGLALWIALNLTFVIRLFRGYLRANRTNARFSARVNLWIMCCWLAVIINGSFDVYLEGPDGGILFWCIIGLGVAALRIQRYEARQAAAQSRLQAMQAADAGLAPVSA